ncbi:MAG: DNA polymerase/3'-5' exonuclease PolX [Halobacteriota archaeon]
MSENDRVADLLEEFADRLEAMDVEFKPRAYRRAADHVRELDRPIESVAEKGVAALQGIEGVGEAIAEKILEYLETGSIDELEELRADLPVDMDALTRVEGIGPKRVGALYEALAIRDLDDLEREARAGAIREVEGFGETSEQNILEHLPFAREAAKRHLLYQARSLADTVLDEVGAHEATDRCDVAGSIRRWLPTIGDVDVLVATVDAESIVADLDGFDFVAETIEAGARKASVRNDGGIRVDFRFVDPSTFGAALQYFTGSKHHNVQVRQRAIDRGLKVNEYGVFTADDERVAGETEASVYEAVDLPWMAPELRQGRGELDAADAGALPDLLEESAMRGDLHTHSTWSDGSVSILEMARGAAEYGHEYLAITDHATGPGVVADTGVPDDQLLDQRDEIEEANDETSVTLFHGVEANIAADGSISVADDVLEQLDVVVASPHAALSQPRDAATERLVRAIEHPSVDIIGHPTGRKLGQRPGLPIDIERVATAAADEGVALEINSHPVRLDLDGELVRTAVEQGATVVISTDAHVPHELDLRRYGVHTARRGWCSSDDVLTSWPVDDVRSFLG